MSIKKIAESDRKTAENAALKQCTDIYNNTNPKDVDMPVLELALRNSFGMGVMWTDARNKVNEKELKKKYVDSGVWLAITEFAFHHEAHQLLDEVIKAMGFTYEECLLLMEQNDTNREYIEPYVKSVFRIDDNYEE